MPPAELPAGIGDFAGRTADLRELRRTVAARKRVIAVVGPVGMGKSTLAIRLGHEIRAGYPDRQLYVNLGVGRGDPADPATVPARFLAALGAGEDEQRGQVGDLAARSAAGWRGVSDVPGPGRQRRQRREPHLARRTSSEQQR